MSRRRLTQGMRLLKSLLFRLLSVLMLKQLNSLTYCGKKVISVCTTGLGPLLYCRSLVIHGALMLQVQK